jgi:hypothetical protein
MKEYARYHFRDELEVTIVYEFDAEEEMKQSGLLDDERWTTCYMSSGKYYVGGHFENENRKNHKP